MTEIVRQLGADRRVLAIFTPPDAAHVAAGRAPLGCILVNAGVIHRVGPHRLNVKLARHLAAEGVCVGRLDLSGRGDTPAARTQLSLPEQAVADIRGTMDEMQRSFGCERFVMFGICSGAVNAMDAALADPRLAGIALLDGYAFPTWKTHAIRYARALANRPPAAVFGSLLRAVKSKLRPSPAEGQPVVTGNRGLGFIPVQRYREMLSTLARQGTQVSVLFTGSIGGHYNHDGQFEAVFGRDAFGGRVRCEYLPQLDHTLTTLAAQAELMARLSNWVRGLSVTLPGSRSDGSMRLAA